MSSNPSDRLPAHIGGKYRPLRIVGKGGMSVVYEAEHEHTGDRVALKVLRSSISELEPAALARFRREARISSLVKSDHIIRVFDADVAPELDGAPFLVMDLLEGADLAKLCGDEPQNRECVVDWLGQIARALDKAHAQGIVHRDLKPENLFLAERPDGAPIVKILDFGIAKIRAADDARKTATGNVIGTPLYMSPEQANSADEIGSATDIWALGMIAFRFLTGRDYWDTTHVPSLLAMISFKPIEPPSLRGADFGPAFDEWFLRSCHRDPAQRFQTATQQVSALAEALEVPAGRLSQPSTSPTTTTIRSLSEKAAAESAPTVAATPNEPGGDETLPLATPADPARATRGSGVLVANVQPLRRRGGRYALAIGLGIVIAVAALISLVRSSLPQAVTATATAVSALPTAPKIHADTPATIQAPVNSAAVVPSPSKPVAAATAKPTVRAPRQRPRTAAISSVVLSTPQKPPSRDTTSEPKRDPLADPK